MRIANIKKSPEGKYIFTVSIPFLAPTVIEMQKIESANDRAPDWDLLCDGGKCGALWRRMPKSPTGESFLSGMIESPAFPGGRLDVAVFKSKDVGGQMDMVWSPPRDRGTSDAPPPSQSSQQASSAPPAGRSGEDDDDIPF
jgi:uncharacterized protein (DUF736 family)